MDAPLGSGRGRDLPRSRWLLGGLLAFNLLLRIGVSLRPLHVVDDLAVPDDAYLSLTLARNIARGLGPFYGLDYTNGFQPLYVFLMAPVFRLLPHDLYTPMRVAFVLLALFDTLALALMVRWLGRMSAWVWTPSLFALAWALSPYAVLTSLNGLETSISFCCLVAVLERVDRLRDSPARLRSPGHAAGFGALLGLAVLTRIDNLLLVPVLAAALLAASGRGGVPGAQLARWAALALLGAAALYLPWLLYSWHYTHELLPVSGRAVRDLNLTQVHHHPTWGNFYWPMLRKAAEVVVRKNVLALGLTGVASAALLAHGRRAWAGVFAQRVSRLWPMASYGALLFAAYAFFVFGYWNLPRYLFPLSLPLGFLAFTILDAFAARIDCPRLRRITWLSALTLIVAGTAVLPSFRRMFSTKLYGTWGYMRVGEWVRARFAPGTTIGGSQTGALGYFADSLVVVNLDGVVNEACYRALRGKHYWRYIRSTGIRYIVWQDDIELIARESREFDPGQIAFVGTIPGIRTGGEGWHVYEIRRFVPGTR